MLDAFSLAQSRAHAQVSMRRTHAADGPTSKQRKLDQAHQTGDRAVIGVRIFVEKGYKFYVVLYMDAQLDLVQYGRNDLWGQRYILQSKL